MVNHYTVKVSLSRILRNQDESTYTMFIDGSKISIIYELTEWIRWLFSLQECFYVTHENSVIHDFEDIRILSTVKELILKPCQSKCFHKGAHKILFSKIDVFTQLDNLKVPKIFLEKINDKIIQTDSVSISNPTSGKSKKKKKTLDCNPEKEEEVLATNELSECEKNSASVKISTSDQTNKTSGKVNTENGAVNEKSKESITKKKVSDSNLGKNAGEKSNPLDQAVTSPTENVVAEIKVKTEPKPSYPSRFAEMFKFSPKPFCVGDLLSNLREENKTQVEGQNNAEYPDKDSGQNDNDFEEPKKKKKRKRTRSKKKLNSELGNFCPVETVITPLETKYYPEDKKPSHIRFDVDYENEFMEMELPVNHENKGISKFTYTSNIQRRCCPNLISTNLDEIKAMINEKTQTLSSLDGPTPFYRNNSTQASNGVVNEDDNIIIFEEQSGMKFEGIEPSCANQDLKLLKDKFPCPVVIERFY